METEKKQERQERRRWGGRERKKLETERAREEEREAGWRHGVRWLGRGEAGGRQSEEGVWVRSQEVTPGRSRRQREE